MNKPTPEVVNFISHAIAAARSDDLERANRAFGHMSQKELSEQHGVSGRTRREIWNEYKTHRKIADDARAWFNEIVGL